MQRTHVLRSAAAAVAAAALLAGCGGTGENTNPAPATPPNTEQSQNPEAEQGGHNQADVAFLQGMIPHHEQAIEMSRPAPERAQSDQVKDLARQIEAAQGPEIQAMSGMLRDWGVPESPSDMHGMDHGDMGMMSPDQMQRFGQAEGAQFDRMFLTMMIEHHEGAVTMARTELDDGQNPEAKQLAQQIIDSQRAEIDTMNNLLEQN
ncbi:DUF305 domain-containing protein [Allosaccharopolyspora coralli]|uniref:DUF305 domain-containing protein n=1 Tax=Allosaccharopolyspora coralli TaxID=2665642 RepID=A0A5Q3QAG1_9PSEU|nr:DUF305 domain-containing protein [Allosaccharopolyspora coralli]QGK68599.1 DUF305 domain-containing protein [Allosaccharopolyspora coralli]